MVDDASATGGPRDPGALEWVAAEASVEDLAVASGAKVAAGVSVGLRLTKLKETRPRTRSGSLSPSWASWSRS